MERVNYIPVQTISRGVCTKEYKKKQIIGKGGFGSVYQICYPTMAEEDCNYVMKVQNVSSPERRNMFERDAYFSKLLGEEGLAPAFYDAWICDGNGFIITERFTTTVDQLAQWTDQCDSLMQKVISTDIVEQMVAIAKRLSELGIIHGDLKDNNFVYKKGKIAVIDFGFTTDFNVFPEFARIGWLSVPTINKLWIARPPKSFDPLFNLWELALNLSMYCTWRDDSPVPIQDIMSNKQVEAMDKKYVVEISSTELEKAERLYVKATELLQTALQKTLSQEEFL